MVDFFFRYINLIFLCFSVVLYLSGQLTTVMGHAISEVNCLEKPNPEMKEMLSRLLDEKPTYEQQWLDRRKSHLAQWLHDNRFPVEVEGERIIVASALDILPPYNINSCHTSNEIILGRVQRLIEAMPQ